ncbi:transcription initiation factor TFIID subunit 8 [Teleopsis dalmanni]|uniref:transcription initiation factor TFIID subunit 8 n=1 Tax=Teleopsis dalmanni TaxID=139649 RepID=UPI0018CEED80|nr:transcription initiation factor TFIID subunit 8 [Teleopsis dalmanni]
MEKPESILPINHVARKILSTAVAQILYEKGFESADKECIETITEILQSTIMSIGQTTRSFCELSGRTTPVVNDVIMGLINLGIQIRGIAEYAKRENRLLIPMPAQASQQKSLSLLQAGNKANHPPHVSSFLPVFPDPHAYIRTPTHKQPVTEYEAIREKAATQKRDIEKALTKFLSKTSETHSLFDTEDNMFPLIACKPSFPPYLSALNPTDQVFDFEELEYHYLVANRTEDVTTKDDNDENESGNEFDGDGEIKNEQEPKPDASKPTSTVHKAIMENPNIDNPYLRTATLPKRSKSDALPLLANFNLNNKTQG